MAAKKGNKYAEGIGRPTKYKSKYDNQVYKLCLLGAIDKEIADFFEVEEQTINNWKLEYPSFFESMRAGKSVADMNISESLYNRAQGSTIRKQSAFKVKRYKQVGEKVVADEEIEIVDLEEQVPPDTLAIKYWLSNRRPKDWKEKHEVDLSNSDGTLSNLSKLSTEELLARAQAAKTIESAKKSE